jgi:hypothetical protein
VRGAVVFASSVSLTLALMWGACSRERPNVDGNDGGSEGTGNGPSSTTGFVTDGAAICGADVHTPIGQYPLIYFVIDRSGSMAELDEGSGETRYERVRDAAVDMVQTLGALVRVGAALFPDPDAGTGDECDFGQEVYEPNVGAGSGFVNAIDQGTFGGTPTARTLLELAPALEAEESPKVVILATDGAPNCNPDASCDADECMVNIFGDCPAGTENCCDPDEGGTVLNCVDRPATVLAVQAIANAGTDVYIVGIPGTEQFSAVLDQMAIVGGVPQEGEETYYYRVDDLDALAGVFKDIASALVSCTYDLADPPEAPGKTNVYFDEVVVLQDPDDGWVWVDSDTIELVGAACEELKSGSVSLVQIVSGCPTETPR